MLACQNEAGYVDRLASSLCLGRGMCGHTAPNHAWKYLNVLSQEGAWNRHPLVVLASPLSDVQRYDAATAPQEQGILKSKIPDRKLGTMDAEVCRHFLRTRAEVMPMCLSGVAKWFLLSGDACTTEQPTRDPDWRW